ncbi:MAG: YIP1 family protein [Verrucomicrobiales bacterium]|nr:YIP1 family protein [Verrucomicrobiales bacterium]
MNSSENEPPPAEEVVESSQVSRMFNIYAVPSESFDALRNRPTDTGNWLLPAILLMVVGWIGSFLILSRADIMAPIRQAQEQAIQSRVDAGKMSAEQAEIARVANEKWAPVISRVAAVFVPVLQAFAIPFWWGLLLWLFGGKLLKGGFRYMKAVEIAGLSSMILVLESVTKTLLVLVTGNIMAGPGLIMLILKEFDPKNLGHALLASVQVTTLWVLAVRAIGISRLGAGGLGRCAALVFGFWIVWTAFWALVGHLLAGLAP